MSERGGGSTVTRRSGQLCLLISDLAKLIWKGGGFPLTEGVIERVQGSLQAQRGAAPPVRHVVVQRPRTRQIECAPARGGGRHRGAASSQGCSSSQRAFQRVHK